VLRASAAAFALVVAAALFGGVTVILGNAPMATVGHWLIAALTVAAVATAVIRTGALGGRGALAQRATDRARRGTLIATGLTLVVIMLGGLTAKTPGASWSCLGFPLCNGELLPSQPAQHVHMTHRLVAFLLFFHVIGLTIGVTKREEAPVVRRAVWTAMALIGAQLLVAAVMVSTVLPPVLRSVHQALGVAIWVAMVVAAYLARIASGASAYGARSLAGERTTPGAVPDAAKVAS
jgi:heme A synthase